MIPNRQNFSQPAAGWVIRKPPFEIFREFKGGCISGGVLITNTSDCISGCPYHLSSLAFYSPWGSYLVTKKGILGEGGKTVTVCPKTQKISAPSRRFNQNQWFLYLLLGFYRRRRKIFELFASFCDDFTVKNVDFSMQNAESKYQIPKIFACGLDRITVLPPLFQNRENKEVKR